MCNREEDEWCPSARSIREQFEGPYNRHVSKKVNSPPSRSTLSEDAHDPLLVKMRAESGEIAAQRLLKTLPKNDY